MYSYSQVPNKGPPCLLIFEFFPTPRTLLGPPFINFKEIEFIAGLLCYFFSLLVLFTPNFQGKLTCFCIYFSSRILTPPIYFEPPPIYFEPLPRFFKFQKFFQPPSAIIGILPSIWHLRVKSPRLALTY